MSSPREKESETSSTELGFFNEESFHSQYIVLRNIGQGSSAKVKLAHHRLTGMPVAVKVLLKKKQWCSPLVTEVDILKFINHPNIISLLQVIQSEKRIYLIMELVEGQQLYRSIRESGCLSEDEARTIFQQIVSAVSYCHNNDIIHRDLKPDNIMVDSSGKVKIIDFGLGTKARPGQKLDQLCGAYAFGAPELHLGHTYDGPKVDMWTLGVLLYFIVTGKVPFNAITVQELREQVIHGIYKIPSHLSDNLKRLLRSLLSVKPKFRPTVEEVLKHPWLLSQDKDLSMHDNETIPTSPDPAIIAAMS